MEQNPTSEELRELEQRIQHAIETQDYAEAQALLEQLIEIRMKLLLLRDTSAGELTVKAHNILKELIVAMRERVEEYRRILTQKRSTPAFEELKPTYVEKYERLRDQITREAIRSEIAVPIFYGDNPVGVLHLYDSALPQLTDEEIILGDIFLKELEIALQESGRPLFSSARRGKKLAIARPRAETPEGKTSSRLVLTFEGGESWNMTPRILATSVSPFLNAISDIQRIIDEILGRQSHAVTIKKIQQYSPISVSLEGAAEAVQVVQDTVIPWKRKHNEMMAHYLEQEKQADIESKKAEILEKRAAAAKSRAEADKLVAEAAKQREEAEKMKLENEKLRLELHRAKIQLAIDILNQFAPNLSETDRIAYLMQLLPPLDIIISGTLQIDSGTPKGAG